ncbi:MAG: hypothetical protein HY368_03275 [Candidatus Aenigmarchaeota archaeon]|nr:hypothetical protein [Candidatus Aenigmarchaeota archaeon]
MSAAPPRANYAGVAVFYLVLGILSAPAFADTALWLKDRGKPPVRIPNARVLSIEPYDRRSDLLGWRPGGYELAVEGIPHSIKVPHRSWNPSIRIGDTVDVTFRTRRTLLSGDKNYAWSISPR